MERYVRKYGDAAFALEAEKTVDIHNSQKSTYNAKVTELLSSVYELTDAYVRSEVARLAVLLERLSSKVPEFRELGLADIEEKLAELVRDSEVVLERLRAKIDEMKNGEVPYLTLDEAFDLVKQLEDLWAATERFVKFYSRLYSDLSPLFLVTS